MKTIYVAENDAGMRLKKYLAKVLDLAPESFIYKNLRKKNIRLNGRRAKGSETLAGGDRIELYFSEETYCSLTSANVLASEAIRKDRDIRIDDYCTIVYEDKELIIADKKAGVLSQKAHPGDISLNEALRAYIRRTIGVTGPAGDELTEDGVFRPSAMNRLDRNTSGLICFAKTYLAARELSRIFRTGGVDKYYLTAVEGVFDESIGSFEGWLIKDPLTNTVKILDHALKGAALIRTEYELMRVLDYEKSKLSILRVKLLSGKTHQIRASLSSLGHPVLGDKKYGGKIPVGDRALFLHAFELRFHEDIGEPLRGLSGRDFTSLIPERFNELLGI